VLSINKKHYGENSQGYSAALSGLAQMHYLQKDFGKAQLDLETAAKIDETLYVPEGPA
jgi:hypothetical protein